MGENIWIVRVAELTPDNIVSEESVVTSFPWLLVAADVRNNAGFNDVDAGPDCGADGAGEAPAEPPPGGLGSAGTGISKPGGVGAGGVGIGDGAGGVGATTGVMAKVPLTKPKV